MDRTPTPEILRQLLDYDTDTGVLTWKLRPAELFSNKRQQNAWNARYAGKPALTCVSKGGYLQGSIFNRNFQAHRVIWAIQTGAWPTGEIDHENGIRHENWWGNLRDVSSQENSRNIAIPSNNTSGHIGVYWNKRLGRWLATIKVGGRDIYLGCFIEIADAVAARKAAEVRHGFHANHGRTGSLALERVKSRVEEANGGV